MYKRNILGILVFIILISVPMYAATDVLMGFQGYFLNATDNSTIETGNLQINISTTNSCNGEVYSEIFIDPFSKGIADVMLGDGVNLPMLYGNTYYLCTVIDGEQISLDDFMAGVGQIYADDTLTTAPANGATQFLSTADDIYDWVTGLGYLTKLWQQGTPDWIYNDSDSLYFNSSFLYSNNASFTGRFETNCMHCEDNDTYFHGDGFFEGNVTAPNIEVMESLIVHGNSTCSGTAMACGDIVDSGLCGWGDWSGQYGCYWILGNCVGTATACEDMSTATCERQHVCTLTTSGEGYIFDALGLHGNFSINTTGNITAEYYYGNGSFLTGIAGANGNPFDQVLNKTSDVIFNSVYINRTDTSDPLLSFVTTNTQHKIDFTLDESSAATELNIEGKTVGQATTVNVKAINGEISTLGIYSGTDYGILSMNAAKNLRLRNTVLDKDIAFVVNDGGTNKTITWDADVDKLRHSEGTFNFDDDNLNTTGNVNLGQKITFALGEFIDNIVDGWIQITGNLNVTGSAEIGNLNITENTTDVLIQTGGKNLTIRIG